MDSLLDNAMTEQAVVRSVHGGAARVEAVESDACLSCGARGACHSLSSDRKREITALNQAGAREGDRVLLAIPRKAALGAGFLVYIVPIMALIAGAVVGKRLAPELGWQVQNGAVALGLASLAACWLALRWVSKRLGKRRDFSVTIVRVLQKGEEDALDQYPAGL